MSSQEIKEAIQSYLECTGVPNSEADWKRVGKKTIRGEVVREFHNAKLGRTVFTLGEDEDATIYESDQWVYGIWGDQDELSLCFEPLDRWRRQGHVYDQHQLSLMEFFFQIPQGTLDEVTENTFVVPWDSALKVHIALSRYGLRHEQALTDFLGDSSSGPAPQNPAAPINPPLPPALDPNWTAPAAPKPQAGSLAAIAAGTSGPVNILQQAANIAGSFGAGGIKIGGLHIPAGTNVIGVGPGGSMTSLTPSHASSQYPELDGLQPAVRQAFEAQRAQGLQGLDQANPAWDDEQAINRLYSRHYGSPFTYEVERSQAIWLLYETTDDGSGEPLPDFFAMTNDEIHDSLEEYGIIDLADDDHEYGVIDDRQPYPAPYDLPVPPPHVHPQAPAQGRSSPMVGPASMNARAGSFAAPQAAPAAVAPPAPPPGNAQANLTHDSGDQWPEFCREVWDTYEANKANLPIDLTWYDRYRPREVQVTGLGYQFERVEYTGIRVLMGYLDRDGALVTTIDLPSNVLSELLKEWGGNWNVDDVTQFINKRAGEDPDTGFSYSSQTLWPEVEAYLKSQGWKEAK